MKSVHELLRENIERWEIRGRGMLTFPEPVCPRPPFVPFPGHRLKQFASGDDGVRHTWASGLLSRLTSLVRDDRKGQTEPLPPEPEIDDGTIVPHWRGEESEQVEWQMKVPAELNAARETMVPFLAGISRIQHSLVFEIVGTTDAIWTQWVSDPRSAEVVRRQMQAHFPDVKLSPGVNALSNAWDASDGGGSAVMEFALSEFFMWPLGVAKNDPFVTLVGALSSLQEGEVGVYQVIFTPLSEPWAESAVAAVSKADGRPFFDDGASLLKAAHEKMRKPLYGVVVRLAARAADPWRAWDIVGEMVPTLAHFSQPGGNEFIALSNEDCEDTVHEADLLSRSTRRCGMLLNQDELMGLVHIPSPAVRAKQFLRAATDTRAAPVAYRDSDGVCIGINTHEGGSAEVWLSREQRVRHMHIMGASGTGKSTLLLQMIHQDVMRGAGIAVLDPHGDLIDAVLENTPEHRLRDVVLIDPSDEEYSVGFNILSAHSDFEKTLLASDLVSVFQRLSTSWGDQMGSVLSNAIRAFLESREGGTLADLRRFLIDAGYRKQFLKTVEDPDMVYYWEKAFPQLGGNKSIGPVLTRLESFLAPKPIRYMVSQKANRIDFSDIMDSGKIFLARLSQGQMGRENAHLLGSVLVAKFQQSAMARQRIQAQDRRPFWLYIDEFQNFITPSMAEILSGARKYRLGLVLAHQELNQLRREPEVANAVLANACVRAVFRVSDADGKALENGFSHFIARDLQNLDVGQAICRIERSDGDFNIQVPLLEKPDAEAAAIMRVRAIKASRERYATPRAEVEALLNSQAQVPEAEPAAKPVAPPVLANSATSEIETLKAQLRSLEEQLSERKSEPVPPASEAPSQRVSKPVLEPVPAELGRGGEDHRAIQQEIKAAAEALGFRATIEKQLPGTLECTDVLLERNSFFIAVEISVTNTIDYELKNIGKCLRAGVSMVAVVAPDEAKLEKLKAAATTVYGEQPAGRLAFFAKDEFAGFLQGLTSDASPTPKADPSIQMHKGWRVKTSMVILSPDEARECEASVARILAESSRRLEVGEG